MKSVFFSNVLWLKREGNGRNKANIGLPSYCAEIDLFSARFDGSSGRTWFTCLATK